MRLSLPVLGLTGRHWADDIVLLGQRLRRNCVCARMTHRVVVAVVAVLRLLRCWCWVAFAVAAMFAAEDARVQAMRSSSGGLGLTSDSATEVARQRVDLLTKIHAAQLDLDRVSLENQVRVCVSTPARSNGGSVWTRRETSCAVFVQVVAPLRPHSEEPLFATPLFVHLISGHGVDGVLTFSRGLPLVADHSGHD